MANRIILLCLLVLCLTVSYIESRRGGSSSRSSSSWGKGWGSSSSSSHSYPSSSSGLSGYGSSRSHSYPSSGSGLSGYGSSRSHSYPSSGSGLSGSSSSRHSYPSSGSGLSGSSSYSSSSGSYGSSSIYSDTYPSWGSSYSGSSSNSDYGISNIPDISANLAAMREMAREMPKSLLRLRSDVGDSSVTKRPRPSSRDSGSSSHSYPSSGSGLSGSNMPGFNYNFDKIASAPDMKSLLAEVDAASKSIYYPKTSSTPNSYRPPSSRSNDFSGHNRDYNHYPRPTTQAPLPQPNYNTNQYRSPNSYHPRNTFTSNSASVNTNGGLLRPLVTSQSYYTSPQYTYVKEYRNSDSRYGDLLTGLTLYNLGRAQSHHHDHYYYDDYYRRRYTSSSSSYAPEKEAKCMLRISEKNKEEVLKIPCEIVSTFTEGSKELNHTQVNQTVCTTNITTVNKPVNNSAVASLMTKNLTLENTNAFNNSKVINNTLPQNHSLKENVSNVGTSVNSSSVEPAIHTSTGGTNGTAITNNTLPENASNSTKADDITTVIPPLVNNSLANSTAAASTTTVNVTVCTTNSSIVDPLSLKGPAADANKMKCVVEIHTNNAVFRQNVDCKTLISYSKMPEPKKDTGILPSREKLKSWVSNPPWWMSVLIAV
ncbi:uncharacterized protein LOC142972500 [Anticarsia gemmatalis]|uniref:uncharacterized protein LOC142972500 n=1 Tax=Anticarsia gemmatalis TaxID=129554 RepID=UPI003F75C5AB